MSKITFGTDFFESQSEIDAAAGAMEGAVYVNMDVSQEFRNKYRERFSSENQISFAGNAYDTARIVIDNVDEGNIVEALRSVEGFGGVLGNYTYVEKGRDRYFSIPLHMKMIVNNTIVTIY